MAGAPETLRPPTLEIRCSIVVVLVGPDSISVNAPKTLYEKKKEQNETNKNKQNKTLNAIL